MIDIYNEGETEWVSYVIQCLHDGGWIDFRSEIDRDKAFKLRDRLSRPGSPARVVKVECRVIAPREIDGDKEWFNGGNKW